MSLVGGARVLAGQAKPKDPNEKYRVRVAKWGKDAVLSRLKKKITKVAVGNSLAVGDRVITGKKEPVDLYCSDWGMQRLKANSILKYLSYRPSVMKYGTNFELVQELEKGTVLTRLGYLTKETTFYVRGPGKITAPKGTAFSVALNGKEVTLIVAEGQVEASLDTNPGETTTVMAGQKLVFSDTLPAAPVPVDRADLSFVNELLSLPVAGIGSYASVRDLVAKDVPYVVALKVDPAVLVDASSYRAYRTAWRPNSIHATASTNFWSVDASGARRNIGKGFSVEDVTWDGKTVLASKPAQGLWTMNFDGSGARRITDKPLSNASFSPDGSRIVAAEGWSEKPLRARATRYWILNRNGTGIRPLTPSFKGASEFFPRWSRGGKKLAFYFGHYNYLDKGKMVQAFFGIYDGDANPPRLLSRSWSDSSLEVSPQGYWANTNISNDRRVYVRIADLKRFEFRATDIVSYLPGETSLLVGRDGTFTVLNADTGVETPEPADLERYPDGFNASQVSPNGEVLEFPEPEDARRRERQLRIGDARVPSIFVEPGVSDREVYQHGWIDGHTVRYGRYIVTLGVKRRPSWAAERFVGRGRRLSFEQIMFDKKALEAWAVNDAGNVAGIVKHFGYMPYFWSPKTGVQVITAPEGEPLFAFGLSNDNLVTGIGNHNEKKETFVWTQKDGFRWTGIAAAQKQPMFSGMASNGDTFWEVDGKHFRWFNDGSMQGRYEEVVFPRGFKPSSERAMNRRGHFVGILETPRGKRLASWNGVDLPVAYDELGEVDSEITIMNGSGQMIYTGYDRTLRKTCTYLFTPRKGSKRIAEDFLLISSLNAKGQAVGIRFGDKTKGPSDQEKFGNIPVYFDGEKTVDLNTLAPQGWHIVWGPTINDRGQIAGRAYLTASVPKDREFVTPEMVTNFGYLASPMGR